jgi:hypothetical protein
MKLPAQVRQLQPASRPLSSKTRTFYFSFPLYMRDIATLTGDSHRSCRIPWVELIVIDVIAPWRSETAAAVERC